MVKLSHVPRSNLAKFVRILSREEKTSKGVEDRGLCTFLLLQMILMLWKKDGVISLSEDGEYEEEDEEDGLISV